MRWWFNPNPSVVCLQVPLVIKGHLPRRAALQWPGLPLRLGQLQHGHLHGPWRLPQRCVCMSSLCVPPDVGSTLLSLSALLLDEDVLQLRSASLSWDVLRRLLPQASCSCLYLGLVMIQSC